MAPYGGKQGVHAHSEHPNRMVDVILEGDAEDKCIVARTPDVASEFLNILLSLLLYSRY